MNRPIELNGSEYEDSPAAAYFFNALFILATTFSLTLLYPLAYCLRERRKAEYTYIDGRKLRFEGKIVVAYAIYFAGLALSALATSLLGLIPSKLPLPEKATALIFSAATTGINLFFTKNALFRWKVKNTHYCFGAGKSSLERKLLKCMLVNVVSSVLGIVTLGISYPFIYKLKESYFIDTMITDGEDLCLHGDLKTLCLYWYAGLLLSVVTLGLFVPSLAYLIDLWTARNIHSTKRINRQDNAAPVKFSVLKYIFRR